MKQSLDRIVRTSSNSCWIDTENFQIKWVIRCNASSSGKNIYMQRIWLIRKERILWIYSLEVKFISCVTTKN